ncbi:MAG: AMP-binding protein [Planctomycetes bacterium]|nr:AMP-binding protein [Planctomycetota bacterium]
MAHSRWDSASPDDQRRMQLARLREFLARQALPFHPFYRELFRREKLSPEKFQSFEDLARIPFSSKANVAPTGDDPDRPRSFVLQPTPETLRASLGLGRKLALGWKKLTRGGEAVRRELGLEYRPVQVFFTTGRTALPTSFLLTRYDLQLLEIVGARIGEIAGIDASRDRVLSVFPYAPHLAFWQVQAVSVATGCFTLQTGGGKVMGTEGILRALAKIRPTFVCGIPGYVYHLLREAVETRIDLSAVRTVFLGGDRIIPGFRAKLIELLERGGAREPSIVSVLGFTEAKKCWTECREGGEKTGLHTYPDLEIFEIVDPKTGEVLPDGESGEMVYTYLDGRGSVVLRYRTGDIVNGGISRTPCPSCGRSLPRLASDLSRASNVTEFNLTKIKGSLVNLNVLADLLSAHPGVDEWQLIIRKRNDDPFEMDEMILALAATAGMERDQVVRRVSDAIFETIELRPASIEVLSRSEILERIGMETRLKENRIVDLRATAGARAPAPAPLPTPQPAEKS